MAALPEPEPQTGGGGQQPDIEQAAHVKLRAEPVPADAREEGMTASCSNSATIAKDKQAIAVFVMKDAAVASEVSERVRESAPKSAKLIAHQEVMVVYAAAGADHAAAVERRQGALNTTGRRRRLRRRPSQILPTQELAAPLACGCALIRPRKDPRMSPTSDLHRRLRRGGALAGLALAALALAPAAALASPAGDLDPSFDRDGRRLLSGMQSANRVLAQPDGKTVVVGGGDGAFHVSRLNGDGSRDRGFGKDGVALIDFGGDDRGLAAALQPDGKIVVAGDSLTQTGSRPAIARLTGEGALDATFDPGGADGDGKKILIGAPIGSDLKSVLVQPDGKLVLAGRGYGNGYSDMAVMRLNRNGSPDGTTFARGSFGSQVDAEAAALLPDGRIVVAGTRYFSNGERYETALTRFNADDGSLDATLGGTGKVTLASDQNETIRAVLAQPDGKLVVAGGTTGNDPEMIVARVTVDGSLDRSFAGDGRAGAGFDGISLAGAVALVPDGKILVAGAVVPPYDFAVARFDSSGALDASFGSAGRTTVGFGLASAASAIALQSDGRAIVAGMAFGGVAVPVARLLADPTPQPGGGGQGGPVGDGGGPGPGGGSGSGGGAPVDRTPPVIGRISLSPKAFAASSRSTAQSAAARGTTIRYTLSEAATVIARIERAGAGRRAGTLRRAGRAGSNRLAFSGRVGRKALRPGAYRLVLTATDAAGNRSAARSARFRILR